MSKNDADIADNFQLSWLHSYMNNTEYDGSSDAIFITGLRSFLASGDENL